MRRAPSLPLLFMGHYAASRLSVFVLQAALHAPLFTHAALHVAVAAIAHINNTRDSRLRASTTTSWSLAPSSSGRVRALWSSHFSAVLARSLSLSLCLCLSPRGPHKRTHFNSDLPSPAPVPEKDVQVPLATSSPWGASSSSLARAATTTRTYAARVIVPASSERSRALSLALSHACARSVYLPRSAGLDAAAAATLFLPGPAALDAPPRVCMCVSWRGPRRERRRGSPVFGARYTQKPPQMRTLGSPMQTRITSTRLALTRARSRLARVRARRRRLRRRRRHTGAQASASKMAAGALSRLALLRCCCCLLLLYLCVCAPSYQHYTRVSPYVRVYIYIYSLCPTNAARAQLCVMCVCVCAESARARVRAVEHTQCVYVALLSCSAMLCGSAAVLLRCRTSCLLLPLLVPLSGWCCCAPRTRSLRVRGKCPTGPYLRPPPETPHSPRGPRARRPSFVHGVSRDLEPADRPIGYGANFIYLTRHLTVIPA